MSPVTTTPRPASETTRNRLIAFTLLVLGVVAVVLVVLSMQRRYEPWLTIGSRVAVAAPADMAIGVFAARTPDDKLAIAAIGRGTAKRCLDIRFEVNNARGAFEKSDGSRCRKKAIGGRGVRVEPNRTVRVFAGGRLLIEVKAADTKHCGAGSNVCAMAFDRKGTRLGVPMRKRRAGEVDRDDLLRATLQSGGSGDRYAPPGQPVAEVAVEQFGAITAQVWPTSLVVDALRTEDLRADAEKGRKGGKTSQAGKNSTGGKKPAAAAPTTAEALGALFTRAPEGFAVRVVDDGAKRTKATTAD